MVLVVKPRWGFAIGVKNFIKTDPHPALLQEMGSAVKASLGDHCSNFFARLKRDCLQTQTCHNPAKTGPAPKGLWPEKCERAYIHAPYIAIPGKGAVTDGISQFQGGSAALKLCLMAMGEVLRGS